MVDKLEIAPHVVEAITNHVSGHKGGIAGVYNRARYRNQMRAALQAWGSYLSQITSGRGEANVVPLRG